MRLDITCGLSRRGLGWVSLGTAGLGGQGKSLPDRLGSPRTAR
jgi:hypothetical protein